MAALRSVGGIQVRYSPWYGNLQAVLVAAPTQVWMRDPEILMRAMAVGREMGYSRFLVQATGATQKQILLDAGFRELDRLHVLFRRCALALPKVPDSAKVGRLQRASPIHVDEVIRVDNACFEPFWAMNQLALSEAVAATPRSRFRVMTVGDSDVLAGYAIFGLGGGEGYLQRIAVDPDWQGRGFATRLIVDGLRWAKRWRARRVGVNTQQRNENALRLYLKLGFEQQTEGISIFEPAAP
ncbi:GNAT family N-acetyltransferase [Ferrimicrobium sp.]|uniref:GNAT family N-acetyltransferase n=1 Tax=Ferrimicrobium sp. TaxID=2926050 RepID=UPI002621C92D|nr:GNAT family N-acetyltransferase [Ferrimicrobium sp.]